MSDQKEKYIEECKIIKQNCVYSAETHHIIANKNKRLAYYFQIGPAIISALSASLVIGNIFPTEWLWLTTISAVITAVASVIDPNKNYAEHLQAAKQFTILKHDARFLAESRVNDMTDDAYKIAVENLHMKYNDLVLVVPPTDKKSFEKAQKNVQEGTHEPDRDADGKIK